MKSQLRIQQKHHIHFTPQLQQAIRILKLSTLDLRQEIQNQLDINPLLEVSSTEPRDPSVHDLAEEEWVDFQWTPLYPSTTDEYDAFNFRYASSPDLHDYLIWQLELSHINDIDKAIGMIIIDAINEDGYLSLSIGEICSTLNQEKIHVSKEEVETVLHRIQRFEPVGCAASTLSESLVIQLETFAGKNPFEALAKRILHEHFQLVVNKSYSLLQNHYQLSKKELEGIIGLISHLNPKPGAALSTEKIHYIIPDLFAKPGKQGQWNVYLNPSALPKVNISARSRYQPIAHAAGTKQYLHQQLKEAQCFLNSIESRQQTLLRVASFLIHTQKAFLEEGEAFMKPLLLEDAAHALNLSLSTISRVTSDKYIHTPRGLFELNYFFSHALPRSNGDAYSVTAIRTLIKKLIQHENKQHPLNDKQLTQLLINKGIQIARRTVSHYRNSLGISPAHWRKSKNRH